MTQDQLWEQLYRSMLRVRRVEEKIIDVYWSDKIKSPVHLSIGQEAVATGAGAYAALEWASYATNRINVGGEDAARDYHDWAQERLAAFQGMLARQGRTRRLHSRRLYEPLPAALGPRPLGE